jgi:hypothetical protein
LTGGVCRRDHRPAQQAGLPERGGKEKMKKRNDKEPKLRNFDEDNFSDMLSWIFNNELKLMFAYVSFVLLGVGFIFWALLSFWSFVSGLVHNGIVMRIGPLDLCIKIALLGLIDLVFSCFFFPPDTKHYPKFLRVLKDGHGELTTYEARKIKYARSDAWVLLFCYFAFWAVLLYFKE